MESLYNYSLSRIFTKRRFFLNVDYSKNASKTLSNILSAWRKNSKNVYLLIIT